MRDSEGTAYSQSSDFNCFRKKTKNMNYGCPNCSNIQMMVSTTSAAVAYYYKLDEDSDLESKITDSVDINYEEDNIYCTECGWNGSVDDLEPVTTA